LDPPPDVDGVEAAGVEEEVVDEEELSFEEELSLVDEAPSDALALLRLSVR
jgi:hypothetical protein